MTGTAGTLGSATGKINDAANFVPSDTRYLSIADNARISSGNVDWTFACWVYADAGTLTTTRVVAHKGWKTTLNSHSEWVLYYSYAQSRFVFAVRGSDVGDIAASTTQSAANWYHIVVWHRAPIGAGDAQLGIAINGGTPATKDDHDDGVNDGTDAFQIGASPDQSLYWDGLIDEAGFWKRVLTDDERARLYNRGNGLPYHEFFAGSPGAVNIESLGCRANDDTFDNSGIINNYLKS